MNKETVEERLLNNPVYRTIMSAIWPYRRAELLWERKALLELCTLMTMFYSTYKVAEAFTPGKTAFLELILHLAACVFAPFIAELYWYLLRYTYDVIVEPIRGGITINGEPEEILFVDEDSILKYVTPAKALTCLAIMIFMQSFGAISQIASAVFVGINVIIILMVIDLCIVICGDYQIVKAIDLEESEETESSELSNGQPCIQQTNNEKNGIADINIIVRADLNQSDEANQKVFLEALTQARKIVEEQKDN